MRWFLTSRPLLVLLAVSCLTMSLAGCARSGSRSLVQAERVQIPAPDPRDTKACYDPGVDGDAIVALTENRTALAVCKRRHAGMVKWSEDITSAFGR
jgi:hypothetical protein